ncbi:MAG: hypothetical protein HOM14_05375 [Gammaproteobacteria bacterium]|jgi:hypothetical protein|nr:hypothetical protein [Gammaproteobacteria bacterium]MBT3723608.1 hypothetical protein [Gammaproteobacteria bacterium]MBT4075413.1 hypothetical protein [Gammaproteobacteria bacterium]MBT4194033.1 hypothetical protein [Gammaproteobacteria bacterium]MBT4449996.1 hypothetical protein [Gammaproteobacteria bacterium]
MAVIKIENLPIIEDLNDKQSKNIYGGGWSSTLGLDPARFGLDPAKFGSDQEKSDSDGTDPAKFS